MLHPSLGFGIDVVDVQRRLRTPGLTRRFLARKTFMENVGEELRVLYVALTRAKEKLVLTGVLKKAEEKLPSLQAVTAEDGFLTFLSRLGSNTFLQFLLLARSCAPENCPLTLVKQESLKEQEVWETAEEGLTRVQLLAELQEPEPEWEGQVAARLSYEYPYEHEVAMKTKVSVSEFKRRAMDQALAEEAEMMFPLPEEPVAGKAEEGQRERYIPAFMEGVQEENIGAKRGTAMHRMLECYDFTRPPETLQEQFRELAEQKKIEESLQPFVRLPAIRKFLRTKLGARMQAAAKQGKLCREKPFVMGKPACEALEGTSSREMVLIQGIIDVFFEEDGEIVLLDYKTDKVASAAELAGRYRTQLELYQEAIERAVGKKVKERLLYSFSLGEIVPV